MSDAASQNNGSPPRKRCPQPDVVDLIFTETEHDKRRVLIINRNWIAL